MFVSLFIITFESLFQKFLRRAFGTNRNHPTIIAGKVQMPATRNPVPAVVEIRTGDNLIALLFSCHCCFVLVKPKRSQLYFITSFLESPNKGACGPAILMARNFFKKIKFIFISLKLNLHLVCLLAQLNL